MFNLQDQGAHDGTLIPCPNCGRDIKTGSVCPCFFDEL